MTLEQLQEMSDAELNQLSAIKVMGHKLYEELPGGKHPFQGNYDWLENKDNYPHYIKYPDGRVILWKATSADGSDWNPTTDMNDAMELQKRINEDSCGLEFVTELMNVVWDDGVNYRENVDPENMSEWRDLPPLVNANARQRTIASILAKESEKK